MATITASVRQTGSTPDSGEPLAPLVLCADDDDSVRLLCTTQLSRAGFRTDTARNGREVLDRVSEQEYDAILLDLDLPVVHGVTVLALIAQKKPELLDRIVIMTGLPDAAFDHLYDGVVLRKPIRNETLVAAVLARCGQAPSDESTARTVKLPAKDSIRAFVASLIQSYSS